MSSKEVKSFYPKIGNKKDFKRVCFLKPFKIKIKKMKRAKIFLCLGLFFAGKVMGGYSVLSFNIWGIKGARYISERIKIVPGAIAKLHPELIVLQEVFESWEAEELKKAFISQGYSPDNIRHLSFSRSSTGMMILSRYPILRERFQPYFGFDPESGKEKIIRAQASFLINREGEKILFITTHIMPRIFPTWIKKRVIQYDVNQIEQILEFFQLAEFIRSEQKETGAGVVIVAGDLNADPCLLSYQLFLALSGLINAYDYLHPQESEGTYLKSNPFALIESGRIDHILFGNFSEKGAGLVPITAQVVFKHPYVSEKGRELYLSDHYGIFAQFQKSSSKPLARPLPDQLWQKLNSEERNTLLKWLEQRKDACVSAELVIKLGINILSEQTRAEKRDSGLVRAGARLIVSQRFGEKFSLRAKDKKLLKKWLLTTGFTSSPE